jgi:Domain of unknown function (DUF4773)
MHELLFRNDVHLLTAAKNPPPICFAIPYAEKAASLCVDFYNLDLANSTFSGCIKLQARLAFVIVESIDFGCFHIPLRRRPPPDLIELVRHVRMRGVN